MKSVEGLRVLSERVVLERDKQDPEVGHVTTVTYIAGTHLEIPGARPHQGWTGDETIVVEEYVPRDPIRIKDDGLLWTCAWHDPDPPLPEGFKGYTHGICPEMKRILLDVNIANKAPG